ncbi:hypothetical protein C5F63_01985 [Photobacterium damselae subsp. damselae]|nr:hypothetical protein C5F63_01985 [Photobacterium damselae subsp. damselae]
MPEILPVHFFTASLGSTANFLSLPSAPTVNQFALATRIIFLLVGVIQISFNLTGLPASLDKRKKPRAMYLTFINAR